MGTSRTSTAAGNDPRLYNSRMPRAEGKYDEGYIIVVNDTKVKWKPGQDHFLSTTYDSETNAVITFNNMVIHRGTDGVLLTDWIVSQTIDYISLFANSVPVEKDLSTNDDGGPIDGLPYREIPPEPHPTKGTIKADTSYKLVDMEFGSQAPETVVSIENIGKSKLSLKPTTIRYVDDSDKENWLSIPQGIIEIQPGAKKDIKFNINVSGLLHRQYRAEFDLIDETSSNSPYKIKLTLNIKATHPIIVIGEDNVKMSYPQFGTGTPKTIYVTNDGGGTMNFTIEPKLHAIEDGLEPTLEYLRFNPSFGEVESGGSLPVEVHYKQESAIEVGEVIKTSFKITSQEATNSGVEFPVEIEVLEPTASVEGESFSGKFKTWEVMEALFDGPENVDQLSTPNPFLDYVMNVTFICGGDTYIVPGHFHHGNKIVTGTRIPPDSPAGEIIVIEAESLNVGGTNWTVEALSENSGYTGSGYIKWTGQDYFGTPNIGTISIPVKPTTSGLWRLKIRNRHNNPKSDLENDIWFRIPGVQNEWIKIYSNQGSPTVNVWNWHTAETNASESYHRDPEWQLTGGQTYELQISGRSTNFMIDRIHFYRTEDPTAVADSENTALTQSSSGAQEGDDNLSKWRVFFRPPKPGTYTWSVSFLTGADAALTGTGSAVTPTHGLSGSFVVEQGDNPGKVLLIDGIMKWAGTNEAYWESGPNSPENFLAYSGFPNTFRPGGSNKYSKHIHHFEPHGGIFGAIDYLHDKGANTLYTLLFNIDGDGNDIWPWISRDDKTRFDVYKLDAWTNFFNYMEAKGGWAWTLVFQETENDSVLDSGGGSGTFGNHRKLYMREMISRFAHFPIFWLQGEEPNIDGDFQDRITAQLNFLRDTDPYDSPRAMHNHLFGGTASEGRANETYPPHLGPANKRITSAHLQISDPKYVSLNVRKWIEQSAAAGYQIAAYCSEIGLFTDGITPDSNGGYFKARRIFWLSVCAGGFGAQYYFGYNYPHHDISCEDFTLREKSFLHGGAAIKFLKENLERDGMVPMDHNTLGLSGQRYLIYKESGRSDMPMPMGENATGWKATWWNPETLQIHLEVDLNRVQDSVVPSPPNQDWVLLLRKK